VDRASEWVYRGVWGALVRLFKVPEHAPDLPVAKGEPLARFHPSDGFLKYLKFWFWIVLLLIDGLIAVLWLVVAVNAFWVALLLLPLFLVVAIVPDVFAYVAIHVRYDTTWYVMSPRSLRIRRGVWVINEMTITFENVQNVAVRQGPVQRAFGISNLVIETAGSGSGEHGGSVSNQAIIEGVHNPGEIRDRIMTRVRRSTGAGLGDDETGGFGPEHLGVLREIRDGVRRLASG
jgi:membrane protein YdbS with pleckstrin-like domain